MGGGRGGVTVVERKRKKKGRPSLLDLQKRSLRLQKQLEQQQQQVDASNPNTPIDDDEDDETGGATRRKRREKKLELVLGLPPHTDNRCAQSSGSDDRTGSAQTERRNASSKTMDALQGNPSDSGPTTPLPDKKLLEFVLDRLQKKDTYGVFSEPVDPEELPDYHDIVDHPMDFGTIRKKLIDGIYENLEQFEKDIFLICSNAMHYNAPDTIFFRQARSIQELSKKDFETLRQESDDCEPEAKVVRKGRPKKNVTKKPVGRSPTERACLDFSSDATLATATDNACSSRSSNDQLRRGFASENLNNIDSSSRARQGSCNSEKCILSADLRNEKNEGFSGFALKGASTRYHRNIISNDNRRSTYLQSEISGYRQEASELAIFDGERRQLMPVGLHMETSYTKSLARFAANFGPLGWEIAASLIQKALPSGTKFGRGWVGEKDESQLCQLRLPLVSSRSPFQSVISNDNESITVPQAKFSPAVADNSPVVMNSAEVSKQPIHDNDFLEVNHSDLHQQMNLQRSSNFPIHSTTTNFSNNALRFNPPHNGNASAVTILTSGMHSQVPMTHAQVLNMVSRRDNNLINYAFKGRPESQRTPDDVCAVKFGNSTAHPAVASHQQVEETQGKQMNENSSNCFTMQQRIILKQN